MKQDVLPGALLAALMATSSLACSRGEGGGGPGGGAGSSGASSSGSTTSASTTTSSSSGHTGGAGGSAGAAGSASTTGGGAGTAGSSGGAAGAGGGCATPCATDADCEASCPVDPGQKSCCNAYATTCYTSPTGSCPAPCEPGEVCSGFICIGDPASCVLYCMCDATGHNDCKMTGDLPVCPAVHAACGDPCDTAYYGFTNCMCSSPQGQGDAACRCDMATGTWACSNFPGPCPQLGTIQRWTSCADFPVGLGCDLGECTCREKCGTQVWDCGIGP